MKKILIVGAGIEQVSAIKIAKEMGHFVIVTDMSMDAPGVKYADSAYKVSTTDIEGNIAIALKEKIDGVMTICSETAVPTVAGVAKKMNLPSFSVDTALKATNKAEMRKVLSANKIRVSPYVIARSFEDLMAFADVNEGPWVVKPVDSSGQRGTYIIDNKSKLKQAFEDSIKFSNVGAVLADKFIQGPEIHVGMQVIDKKVHFLAFSDRITLKENHFGIAIQHIGPSVLSQETESAIIQMCKLSVESIGLVNGVATCELILKDGEPVLLEIAVRVPGGYLREVAMYLSGIDMVKTTIWNCLGEQKTLNEMKTEEIFSAISVKFITTLNLDKTIKSISNIENVDEILKSKGIKHCNFHFQKPFNVPELKSSVGRFGAIIGVGDNNTDAIENANAAFNLLKFNGLPLIDYKN
ncbi:MAG: ATP-grasp domain-containing protein [Bacteroidales bacterium]|nr:ATP-grasp domain-containing protein [Bacteroidales bacterium]MCF8405477.1 ATP-grasp domain-containing protein [Bacteroidales bacterium]